MPTKIKTKAPGFKNLDVFLQQNTNLNLSSTNLNDPSIISSLDWKGVAKNKTEVCQQLKAYQRLSLLLSKNSLPILTALLEEGIHSAVQIASISKSQFTSKYAHCFGDESELIEPFYAKALAVRSNLLLKYMNNMQNKELQI